MLKGTVYSVVSLEGNFKLKTTAWQREIRTVKRTVHLNKRKVNKAA